MVSVVIGAISKNLALHLETLGIDNISIFNYRRLLSWSTFTSLISYNILGSWEEHSMYEIWHQLKKWQLWFHMVVYMITDFYLFFFDIHFKVVNMYPYLLFSL